MNTQGDKIKGKIVHFQMFFSDFRREITEKRFIKEQKKLKTAENSSSTQKLVEIHNTPY